MNYKYLSPFKVLISFHKLIEELEEIASSEVDFRSNYAKGLLHKIQDKPEFKTGIDSFEFIENNQENIQYLLADLFPTALTNNEIKAVTIPFYDVTFNYTQRFRKIMQGANFSFDVKIRDLDEHQFYVMSCILILNTYYGQNIDISKPMFSDIYDENNILKHYKILYNIDFLEILPTKKTKFLNQSEIDRLIDNYDDFDLWKQLFPVGSWILKGFAIVSLIDVTIESAISNLKSNLLKSDLNQKTLNESFESIFKSVFKIPDLKIGFTPYDEEDDKFITIPSNQHHLNNFIPLNENGADCKNALCGCSYEYLIENNKSYIISDVNKVAAENSNNKLYKNLLNQDIQSILIAPVIKQNKLLGLIQLASSTVRAINSVNAKTIELLLPYITDTVDKYNADMINQIDVIIQKEYTSIHPSVYWSFKKEAKNFLHSNMTIEDYTFKEIVFKDVYPLYGQIDIKSSSENRIIAVVNDLKRQLNKIIEILKSINLNRKINLIEQKIFELKSFLYELDKPFQNNLEQIIHNYIENEIHSFLKNYDLNSDLKIMVENYFSKIDSKTGMFYQTRKDFDDTIMTINNKLASVIDLKQKEAQEIFPHYFERFKTDGVEHNLYIGESIEPEKKYNNIYLHNLRLWQLETLCEMEIAHYKLKETLPYSLDVTSLILVFSSPISIRFRMDEKRFDVDGSYNARYEVVKKRIDKAYVKNSTERITQKEKITIVYSNASEEKEYLKYIKYLQHKNQLENEIEKLEVEDLQAVSGLKALRVKVKHDNNDLLLEVEDFITNLFNEKLSSKFSYHNLQHTKKVVSAIETLTNYENISYNVKKNLLLAGWFHDTGYVEGSEKHEEKSCDIAKEFLDKKGVSNSDQKEIYELIMATSYGIKPKNKLEKIIKDADTFHLSTEDYFESLENLRLEWELSINKKYAEIDWLNLNIDFLNMHKYFTDYAKKEWQKFKEKNVKEIKQKLQTIQ